MQHGFLTLGAAAPSVFLADPAANADQAVKVAEHAREQGVKILLFPALSLTGSDCRDLTGSDTLLKAAQNALADYVRRTASLRMLSVLGLPVRIRGRVRSCAAVVGSGEILGLVPLGTDGTVGIATLSFCGFNVQYGTKIVFKCLEKEEFSFCLHPDGLDAGATLLLVPDARTETAGSFERTLDDLAALSRKTDGAILYVNEGTGGATTDGVCGGGACLADGGRITARRDPFSQDGDLLVCQTDADRIAYQRRNRDPAELAFAEAGFHLPLTEEDLILPLSPTPFFPAAPSELRTYADRVLAIQAHGLAGRVRVTRSETMVLGLSGGLDSTWALRVCTEAARILGRTNGCLITVGMPGFGTTARTKGNAERLCEALGVPYRTVPIADSVRQHFKDIGQPEDRLDAVFENAQARERTQILMDLANMHKGLVVGTGDLSELALGFATYGGDQMSMYGVNATLPKTAIRRLVALWAESEPDVKEILEDILDTPVSPELLPADASGGIAQKTESIVGPYVLHDFFLYHLIVGGATPSKLLRMATHVFGGTFGASTLTHTLDLFLSRFFSQQFKRSCMPDGPATGPVSLSPRNGWRMPSDAGAGPWLDEIRIR